jgi:hypothetical protein
MRWVLSDRLQYSLNKYGPITGPREKGWEELTVASLDSALNSWFDELPDHCGSALDEASVLAYLIAFQCAGILDGRMKPSSSSQRHYTLPITSFRSRSIGRSYLLSGKRVPCLSLRSQSVRALPVLPAMLPMLSGRGVRSVLPRISSCVLSHWLISLACLC